MQRGTWILAISGMMALHQSGYSADPAADQPAGQSAVGTTRTSGRKSAIKPSAATDAGPKNYYSDLFGDDGPVTPPSAKRALPASAPLSGDTSSWDDESPSDPLPTSYKRGTAKTSSLEPSLTELPSKSGKAPLKTQDKPNSAARVTQADLKMPQGKKSTVQQVRNDGRPRSAPPVAGFDDPVAMPAKKNVEPESMTRTAFVQDEEMAPARTASIAPAVAQAGPQTPQVTVEWAKRGEFNVGQECLVDLIVKNTGATVVSQIAVDAFFPTNVRLTAAEPRPASATDRLTWTFEQMAPATEQKITVTLIPSRRGEIGATAQVRFTGASSAEFAVTEPLLNVSIKSPSKEVMLGDPSSQMITVTNPGTGTAQDVKIEAKLSDGLEHPSRVDRLVIEVGAVGPGETRTYRLGLTAAKGGTQSVDVIATSSLGTTSSDSVQFAVIAPSLKIGIEGPSLRYKGRNAKYLLTVTNDGSIVNNNIHISQAVNEGFKFVSADHQGKFDPAIRSINWFVGRLEPGESVQVGCELNSLQIGEFAQTVHVVSESGVQAEATIETRIDGIASLTMELVDFDDPVETGSETAYEIRVKNDGSKAATGVSIACELPAGMELLSAKAPVDRVVEGRQLLFKPIAEIAPGAQVTIRIQMKVTRDGSHRLKARLTGGGLQEPMVLEEVTRAYSDGPN